MLTKKPQYIDNNKTLSDNTNTTARYIILNKPIDYTCDPDDKESQSALELLDKNNNIGKFKHSVSPDFHPIGQLDKDSEGLIILTNDKFAPLNNEEEYEIIIDKTLSPDAKKVLKAGMRIEGEVFSGINIIKEFNKGRRTIVTAVLKEERSGQLRKMFSRLGYNVIAVKRARINNLKLGVLPVGKWKFVKKEYII